MSTQRVTPEFKEEAVNQVVEHGYTVPDVAARLWGCQRIACTSGSRRCRRIGRISSPNSCSKPRARLFGCVPRCAGSKRGVTCKKMPRGTLPGSPSEVPLHERAPS